MKNAIDAITGLTSFAIGSGSNVQTKVEESKKAGEKIDGGILFGIVLHRRFQKRIDGIIHALEVIKEGLHGNAELFVDDGWCSALLLFALRLSLLLWEWF